MQKAQLSLARENEGLQYRIIDKDNKLRTLQEQLEITQQKMQDKTKLVMPSRKVSMSAAQDHLPITSSCALLRPEQGTALPNLHQLQRLHQHRGDKYEPNIRHYE